MTKNLTYPGDACTVRTYAHLGDYVRAFAQNHLNLLILLGGPGLAKSSLVRQTLGDDVAWIEGHATPLGIYIQLWLHQDCPLVLDDVDSLYANPAGVRLLKCLCQTEPTKTVAWHSATAALERFDVPDQFTTTSRVVLIANTWATLNANVAAIEDRGHVVVFTPSAREVHEQVGTWFDDQEIYAWFARHLHLIVEPSMRHYVRARELKAAGMDWHQALPTKHLSRGLLYVAQLQADSSYATEEARAQAFVAAGYGCRATYFNHARKLRDAGLVAPAAADQRPGPAHQTHAA